LGCALKRSGAPKPVWLLHEALCPVKVNVPAGIGPSSQLEESNVWPNFTHPFTAGDVVCAFPPPVDVV
jgi:hypothetical protein